MKKIWLFFVLIGLLISSVGSTQAQTRRIIKNPNKKNNAEIYKPNKEGCRVRYVAGYESSPPSDVVGAIKYLYNGLLGRNHFAAVEYSCDPVIESVNLSKTELSICSKADSSKSDLTLEESVKVLTKATDSDGDPLVYMYIVSGGKIIGKGSDIVWELSGVSPGTYKITIGVDDGCGVCSEPMSKEIKVVENADCRAQTPNEK